QLVLEVDVAGRDEGVDARARGLLERAAGAPDVGLPGAREPAAPRPADLARDGPHRLEVALAPAREARLDHVRAEPLELACERELLMEVPAAARRLPAVAQRGVEDEDPFGARLLAHARVSCGGSLVGRAVATSRRPDSARHAHSIGPDAM